MITQKVSDKELLKFIKDGTIKMHSLNKKRMAIMKTEYPKSYKYVMENKDKEGLN